MIYINLMQKKKKKKKKKKNFASMFPARLGWLDGTFNTCLKCSKG